MQSAKYLQPAQAILKLQEPTGWYFLVVVMQLVHQLMQLLV